MSNKIYLTMVDPKEYIRDYRDQIIAIVENIDNIDNLELIQSIVFNIFLSECEVSE